MAIDWSILGCENVAVFDCSFAVEYLLGLWVMTAEETITSWSEKVAGLGVDMLVDHGLITKADFERATSVVAKEIRIRLAIGDYPPLEKPE